MFNTKFSKKQRTLLIQYIAYENSVQGNETIVTTLQMTQLWQLKIETNKLQSSINQENIWT